MKWSNTFTFKGKKLYYNRIRYNNPSERGVEVSIGFDFLANAPKGARMLEVGNVLSNYENSLSEHLNIRSRRIVDKFEDDIGVDKIDLMDIPSTKKYDAILSISTVEHIEQGLAPFGAYGESRIVKRNREAPLKAIAKIYDLLAINGKALITVPFGKLIDAEWFIQFSQEYLELLTSKYGISKSDCHTSFLKKTDMQTNSYNPYQVWIEVQSNELQNVEYNWPFPCANAVAIIELDKQTEDYSLNLELPEMSLVYHQLINPNDPLDQLSETLSSLSNEPMPIPTNSNSTTTCKICNSESHFFETALVLNKHQVNYFQCSNCGFVQTEEPHWLDEAYLTPIANSDVGLISRNLSLSRLTEKLILNYFNIKNKFLDYGCGYGLMVRMMRDLGFNFYGYDKYCQNLFAQRFVAELEESYELATAFEVFEHLVNPLDEIEQILKFSKNILFSTQLLPPNNPKPNEWWYYALHEGQHISIYTPQSLSIIAEKFSLNLYTNGSSVHLLTEKKLPSNVFETLYNSPLPQNRPLSLIEKDFQDAISGINHNQTPQTPTVEESQLPQNSPKIVIDGVFFQLYKTGIARVWRSLLEEWAKNGFSPHIVVLDRVGTAPKIPRVFYRTIPAYDYNNTDSDRQMLQQVCDEEGADLFISTYYTTPISTPSIFMAYDMIPEVLGADFNEPMWREKHHAIRHASAYISISENTASDLVKCFSGISPQQVTVAHCGVSNTFSPAIPAEIQQFKIKYGISKPYFILVGAGSNYKNAGLFFQAFDQLYSKQGFEIVCTGGSSLWLSTEYRQFTSGCVVHPLQLSDEELAIAYSGATALVYPSLYEGFGMPVAEAMACGCPVITCPNSSLPEVGGEAVIYINENDLDGLIDALCDVQKPKVRNSLIAAGLEQAKKFSWQKMADTVSSALINATLLRLNLREINLIIFPDWSQPEESLGSDLAQVIKSVITHPDSSRMTLLIDNSNISPEEADLALSSIVMNLMMEEELEVADEPNISLIGQLSEIQWSALIPHLQGRIVLEHENQDAIKQTQAENIPTVELDS
ncbi:MAG: methyltransferase domain-containing protein [Lyngbya sp.]|nr:methyltransferase domain-containing protein [Lyngbya sp.]